MSADLQGQPEEEENNGGQNSATTKTVSPPRTRLKISRAQKEKLLNWDFHVAAEEAEQTTQQLKNQVKTQLFKLAIKFWTQKTVVIPGTFYVFIRYQQRQVWMNLRQTRTRTRTRTKAPALSTQPSRLSPMPLGERSVWPTGPAVSAMEWSCELVYQQQPYQQNYCNNNVTTLQHDNVVFNTFNLLTHEKKLCVFNIGVNSVLMFGYS